MSYFDEQDRMLRASTAQKYLKKIRAIRKSLSKSIIVSGGGSIWTSKIIEDLKASESRLERYIKWVRTSSK